MTPTPDVSPVPPTAPTELYEILERFAEKLDGDDLSDLSRMCREYAQSVHESRLAPALAERRMATDSWHKKFDDLIEESLRLFREVERLSATPVAPTPDELQKLVDEQAEDEMLWFVTENITEAYLQQELRRLHAAIENRPDVSPVPPTAWSPENLEMARLFHDVYEEEAQNNEWESQTPVGWDDLPPANKRTMLATVARVRSRIAKTVYSELIEQINELERLSAPPVAPSVGELEWHDVGPRESYCAKWRIYQNPYVDHAWLMLGDEAGEVTVASAPTIDEAKSLANSLQRILSGAAE